MKKSLLFCLLFLATPAAAQRQQAAAPMRADTAFAGMWVSSYAAPAHRKDHWTLVLESSGAVRAIEWNDSTPVAWEFKGSWATDGSTICFYSVADTRASAAVVARECFTLWRMSKDEIRIGFGLYRKVAMPSDGVPDQQQ